MAGRASGRSPSAALTPELGGPAVLADPRTLRPGPWHPQHPREAAGPVQPDFAPRANLSLRVRFFPGGEVLLAHRGEKGRALHSCGERDGFLQSPDMKESTLPFHSLPDLAENGLPESLSCRPIPAPPRSAPLTRLLLALAAFCCRGRECESGKQGSGWNSSFVCNILCDLGKFCPPPRTC